MYFKVKQLICHDYKVQFLKVDLSVISFSTLTWPLVLLILYYLL